MSYGIKYTCDFNRLENSVNNTYTLEIYKKDYSGDATAITGGAEVCLHAWDTDEPKAPIKGSSLTAVLLNEAGNISLLDLYSTDDDEFKVKLVWHGPGDVTMFEGFLVQDDSREEMVDFTHEIRISANDNLGLLKDVPFNQAPHQAYVIFATEEDVDIIATALHTIDINSAAVILPNDVISLTGTLSGSYHVTGVEGQVVTVRETVTTVTETVDTLIIFRADMYTLRTLLDIIHSCFSATGLELHTRVYANIHEVNHDAGISFLEQTLIDPQTFFSGDDWDDCYNVLEKIFTTFSFTLFQALGRWNIVRWDEARYYDYNVPGWDYDQNFENATEVFLDEDGKFIIGVDEDSVAETGLQQGITRPYKYVKETFNYKQPDELLRNGNLQQLGSLLNTYTVDDNTITEYDLPWWTLIAGSEGAGPALWYIRITQDILGNEIDRALVLTLGAIESYPIQAGEGDRFTFSFSIVTSDSLPGPLTVVFEVKANDGSTVRYLQEDGTWSAGVGYNILIATGDNANTTHTFDISGIVPYDGLLTFSLEDFQPSTETYYRDVRLEYTPMINKSTKIIGHTHTAKQDTTTKNNSETEISIDDSPRNSIAGTLFLDSTTGVLQDRTALWTRDINIGSMDTEERRLGDIITFENLFLRSIARTLLEGTFYGLQSPGHISLLSLCRYTYFSTHNFILGRLEIDYRANKFTATLFEMYKDTEADTDLVYNYIFNYLYDTK